MIQAEPKSRKRGEIASLGRGTDAGVAIVDDERVLGRQQGVPDVGLPVAVGVPRVAAGRLEGHVLRQGPGVRHGRGRDEHVHGRGRALEVGVVPSPGDEVADLVQVGRLQGRGRGDHHDGAGWVLGRVLGVRGGLGRRAVAGCYAACVEVGLLG